MNRARFVFAAALVGAGLAGPVLAQTPQAPPLTPVLAGRNIKPPFKGNAAVDFAKPNRSREKDMVIEKIQVKNMSNAPIARLTIDETWYDKGGATIGGGRGLERSAPARTDSDDHCRITVQREDERQPVSLQPRQRRRHPPPGEQARRRRQGAHGETGRREAGEKEVGRTPPGPLQK